MKTAGAVIIGGGVIGASIAYHLAQKGFKDIVVVDKGSPLNSSSNESKGSIGSTGRATGGFRAQFGSQINIQLSLLSRKKLLTFKDETDIDPCFQQHGYLFLAQSQDELLRLKEANELQRSCGLTEAEMVSVDEIKKLNPHVNSDSVIGGTFCSSDGFISPLAILQGYTNVAIRHGVKFVYDSEVSALNVDSGRIVSAVVNNETISSDIFINGGGAWAGDVVKLAGIEIPLKPLKRQVCKIAEKDSLPSSLPMTIWIDNSFHFRMRDGHLILLMPCEPENTTPFDMTVEESWLNKVFNIGKEKIQALKNCNVDISGSWAGLYEMSPDEHVMLGLTEGLSNFYLANGSSGHGVMHSPAIGQLLAEHIAGEQTTIDISPLSPNRFADGNLLASIEFF